MDNKVQLNNELEKNNNSNNIAENTIEINNTNNVEIDAKKNNQVINALNDKNNISKKEKNRIMRSLAFTILSFIIFSGLLIAGCFLIGFGHKNYLLFDGFYKFYLNETGSLDGFWDALKALNERNPVGENWAGANINLFAPGITLFVVGAIGIIVQLVFVLKAKK